jgi:hypothetical protein
MRRMSARRMGTTGRTGLTAACLLARGRGSMGRVGSTGMWTIGMTRTMGIVDRCRAVGRSRSTTSRATRLEMDAGTSGRRGTRAAENMRCRAIVAAAVMAGRVAVVDTRVAADVTRWMS